MTTAVRDDLPSADDRSLESIVRPAGEWFVALLGGQPQFSAASLKIVSAGDWFAPVELSSASLG
jgi:hypothetical protein